jgi:hypothetical protein
MEGEGEGMDMIIETALFPVSPFAPRLAPRAYIRSMQ